ncbi:MAG TPA: hypothetical protein VG406_12525 [Isosphaeraceae bacterium]|jgi:hypothetical protein|nr:hypothetical protein [Isosphaeraceae bacterium]
MMNVLNQIVAWLDAAADAVGGPLLAFVGSMPGWLSATIVAAVTGVLLLVVFKYTSKQDAIKKVRNGINAELLALKLFKDSPEVALRAQGRIVAGAGKLFVLAIVPMLAMAVPVTLMLGQLSVWYQARPLKVGEETVVTLRLNGDPKGPPPPVALEPDDGFEVTLGPVRAGKLPEFCWIIKGRRDGEHRAVVRVGEATAEKQVAVGDRMMRVSALRPGWRWSDMLLYPWEPPFRPDSPFRSIEVVYPRRSSWTSGTDNWVIYWFVASFVAALAFRRALNVNV